jgi:2-isopropylmalate synthase
MNGYGERVGNCNLITVIPIVELKLKYKALPKNKLTELTEMSRFTDELANQNHDIRAPFVGITSFAHKGGMHVNAVNKVSEGYEHINPALVGNQQRILIGELSGKTNVMMRAKNLGIHLEEKSETTKDILNQIKALENKGYEFEAADASFELLIRKHQKSFKPFFEIVEYHTTTRTNALHEYDMCEATAKVLIKDKLIHTVSSGSGPISALDKALRRALSKAYPEIEKMHLFDYKVRIINSSAGTDAVTRVLIKSSDGQNEWITVGASTSIMEASMAALTDSVEYFLLKNK